MQRWALISVLVMAAVPAGAGWEEGRAAYAAGNFEQALTELGPVVATHPDWGPGHYLLGLTLYRLQRLSEAIPSLERALELQAGEPNYVLALATALVADEKYGPARERLAAVEYSSLPESLRVTYAKLLATAAVRSDQPREAVAVLQTAVAEHAGDHDLWVALGQARAAAGDDVGAFEAYSKALEIDPKDAATSRRAAQTAQRIGSTVTEQADRELWIRWGAELAESAASAAGTLEGYLLAGEVWLAVPDAVKAKVWLDKALELAPADPTALYYRGRADLELGNLDAAQAALEKGLAAAAEGSLRRNIMRSLALVHQKRSDYGAAAEVYRQLGDQGRVAEMERRAKILADNRQLDEHTRVCLEQWDQLEEVKERNRQLEGTPAWDAVVAQERSLLAQCGDVLSAP